MSISDIRDHFNLHGVERGVRCTRALLGYCDAEGGSAGPRNYQVLTFDVTRGEKTFTIQGSPVPPGADVLESVRAAVDQAVAHP
jgi:hypothetical protein